MNESFVFYESFVDAIDMLEPEDQLAAYQAISHYGAKGEEPDFTEGVAYVIYLMAKPQIDANTNRRSNGLKGGRPRKEPPIKEDEPVVSETKTIGFENENHRLENEKPNVNVNVNGNVNENENVNENVNANANKNANGIKHPQTPSYEELVGGRTISDPVSDAVKDWIEYKKERREPYKESGLKALLTQIEKAEREYGASAVINLIQESMANGWRGIIWDRLKKPAKKEMSLAERWGLA